MSKSIFLQRAITADFNPGYRFLHLTRSDPFHAVTQLLDHFTLQELSDTWRSWVQCAIRAEYSEFSEGDGRKHLLQLSDVIGELIEALHYALMKCMKRKKDMKLSAVSKGNIHYRFLDEKNSAYRSIYNFTKQYDKRLIKGFLWV